MPRLYVGAYFSIMKIKLLTSATSLGAKDDVVNVGANLAMGLVRRRQAIYYNKKIIETTHKRSEKREFMEIDDSLEAKTVKELQDIAKEKGISYSGLKKTELIKELKQADTTKELKEEYKTK